MLLLLDFDGTLAPIAPTPDQAAPPGPALRAVSALAARPDTRVAVISGRALEDVRARVGLPGVVYAGNHGLEVAGPGLRVEQPAAVAAASVLADCADRLRKRFDGSSGVLVEDKRLTLSVHYRLAPEQDHDAVRRAARETCDGLQGLRVTEGKRVVEIRPDVDWDKGRTARFLLDALEIPDAAPVLYIGDDATDEDAFRALDGRGDGVIVADPVPADTAAAFFLRSPAEVVVLLEALAAGDRPSP